MNIAKILKIIGKNILAFLVGAITGIIVVIKFVLPYTLKEMVAGKGPEAIVVGAIALMPILLIIYGTLGIIIGGFGAIIIYNIVKLLLKIKREKTSRLIRS